MADVQIRFRAQGTDARREIEQLQNEVKELRGQLGQTARAADAAETEVQQLGQQSRQAAGGVDKLGDEARETAQEVLLLGNRFRQTGRGATEFSGVTGIATRGTRLFTGSVHGLGTVLGALGIAAVTQEIGRFGVESVQAAGRMEQYIRATTQIEGSSEAAQQRIEALIEVANLPGLNFEALTRYSNRLRAAGFAADDTDKILLTVGQTIVALGGSAEKAALSMEQIIQAIQLGNIDMRDFRTIIQQIPGFLEVLGDVHGVEANIDGLREAFNKTGGSMRDLLIPAFDELARRFEGPPPDSYIVALDTLENAFFLLQATIGDQFLPVVVRGAQGLTEFFEVLRAGIQDTSTLPEPIQEIIAGAQALLAALESVGGRLAGILGPSVRQLGTEFAGLLGSVLELAGSLLNLLSPVLQGLVYITGTMISAVAQLADQLSTLIEGVSDGVKWLTFWSDEEDKAAEATDRLTKSVEAATAALEENASVGDKQRARLAALQQELETTNASIARYEEELRKAGEAGISNRSTEQFERLLQTARERVPELTAEIEKLRTAYGGLTAELGSDATAVERQEAKLKDLQTELGRANEEVKRYEVSLAKVREETLGETNPAIEHYTRRLEGVKAEQARVNAEIGKAETQLTVLKNATAEATGATDKNTETVKAANVEYTEYRQFIRDATQEIRAFSELNAGLEGFGDFWRVAAGAAGEYSTAIDFATISVTNHAAELEALHNAGFFDGLDDPIADYVAGLQATSEAADNALGPLNRVNRSVQSADADFRNAEERLRDFDDAFKLSEVTIPRVTSEMRQFAGQVPQATQEVIEFRRELETLNRTGQDIDLSSVADALNIQADPLQGANLRGRDAYVQYLKDNAINIGEELASQAIRTAGTLRQIEQDRVENLADLEQEYSDKIIAINEEKRRKLAEIEQEIEEERLRRLAAIQDAFDEAKDAEVEARQEAADRILAIERKAAEDRERLRERLNDRLLELEQRRDERIQELTDGLVERERDRQQEILAITERAAEARAAAEQRYAERVQEINNRLVESVREIQRGLQEEIESLESGFVQRQADRADEIVRITQEAADARAAANETFAASVEGIYRDLVMAWDDLEEGFLERQEDRAAERIAIEQQAADARVVANEAYADRVARISTDLVDEVRRIEAEIVDVQQRATDDRFAIEQESIENRAEANAQYARQLDEIETDRSRQLERIAQEATAARLRADEAYADRFQDIQNDLVDRVVDIQRDLNDTLNDLRDEQLDAEQDRLDSLVDLHKDTQQRIQDLERSGTETREDIERRFQQDVEDARREAFQDLGHDATPEEIEQAQKELTRRLFDLGRERNRRLEELGIQETRRRAAIARRAAAQEQQIAEQAAARQAEIAQQQADARSQAQAGITVAESAAGVTFQEAQANYVPALSAHEQALLSHTEALNRINQDAATATTSVEQTAIDAAATAATTLSETLSAVTAAEQERLRTLETETTATIQVLRAQRTDAETRTGLTFQEALANYTPSVDLNTQALQALTEALGQAETERVSALGAVDAAGAADRTQTQAAQSDLEVSAGVSIEAARANFVPALSRAAQATLTLNETLQDLDTSFQGAIAAIQTAGLVDRQSVDAAVQTAIAEATAQQTALETQAGTTFAAASAAFTPGLSDIAQAGVDRDTAISGIDQTETAEIDAVNAQGIADRLETDAAITEARDVYIKARDAEIFKHNVAILRLNTTEAADIQAIRATLQADLASIDDTLDEQLAEIREQKIIFDTRIGELIDKINEQANFEVAGLKADTAAMRVELEAIAAEQRNNVWKDAILKVANVGITVAGVAAGTALGNPVAGLAAGQAVGGLVEQGGNELFHFHQTDAIANRLARQAAFRRSRPAPNYLPDANQIRNARDVSREIVAGLTEGLEQRSRSIGGLGEASQPAGLPEEVTATVVIQFPDGSVQELADQVLRLREQDRTNL